MKCLSCPVYSITFKALDKESGLHKIGYSIRVNTTNDPDQLLYNGSAAANMKPVRISMGIHMLSNPSSN